MLKKAKIKKLSAVFLSVCMFICITACGDNAAISQSAAPAKNGTNASSDTKWAIYWYLCGSDLESNFACATSDLEEMMEVTLPKDVQVIIQTGGAFVWQNDLISADKLQRYIYDSEGFRLLEELPLSNMGEAQTLADFLSFASENYPAEKTMVSFWNHGGGSVTGAAFDELYDYDSLTLPEMYTAFTSVYTENADNQPVDIIGFDTCLMATVDTAFTFSDIGKYLVASEELEPGNGWLYSGIMQALADNPGISPLDLSKAICDTYLEGCEAADTQDYITLSVTNLSEVGGLVKAYDDFGREALSAAIENPGFFARFSQIAGGVENYGGNTREQGFTNMADLGHMALKAAELLPGTAEKVTAAIDNCIEYKVNGRYRPGSTGLSCYYSYNGDVEDFNAYSQIGPSDAFKYLYSYELTGELSSDGMAYISDMNFSALPEIASVVSAGWEDIPVTINSEGSATVTLGPDAAEILSAITYELYYADPDNDIMLCLGTDNDIYADWDNGVFEDNFRGVWGSIDGMLCYMEISYEGDNYNTYSVPVLLNGEEYNLTVIYDFETEQFVIEGARKSIDESGAADKNLRTLVVGDTIETIHYATALSDDSDELTPVVIDKITVTEQTGFLETELGDGYFILMFAMQDSRGNKVYSMPVTYESLSGVLTASVE